MARSLWSLASLLSSLLSLASLLSLLLSLASLLSSLLSLASLLSSLLSLATDCCLSASEESVSSRAFVERASRQFPRAEPAQEAARSESVGVAGNVQLVTIHGPIQPDANTANAIASG